MFPPIDVGGGSVSNSSHHNLARIPLRWMIRQCFLTNTGIQFHGLLLHTIGLHPENLHPIVKTRPPALAYSDASTTATGSVPTTANGDNLTDTTKTLVIPGDAGSSDANSESTIGYNAMPTSSIGILSEEEEDLQDSLCKIYDQLKKMPPWWILEVLPMVLRTQNDNNEWVSRLM